MKIFADPISREPRKMYVLTSKYVFLSSTKQTTCRNVDIHDMEEHSTHKRLQAESSRMYGCNYF